MSVTFDPRPARAGVCPLYLANVAGLAFAFAIGKTLPMAMDAVSMLSEPLCATSDSAGSSVVELIGS